MLALCTSESSGDCLVIFLGMNSIRAKNVAGVLCCLTNLKRNRFTIDFKGFLEV